MIDFYGITYYTPKYLVETLESIKRLPLNITILDSKSPLSPEIEEICLDYLKKGHIKRFVQASGNCKGIGLRYCMQTFQPTGKWFIASDMDVVAPDDRWFDLLSEEMESDNTWITGFGLSTENYKPPNEGFCPINFGFWFMGIKTDFYFTHGKKHIVDGYLTQEVQNHPPARTKKLDYLLLHRGWDAHIDYPEYWKEKTLHRSWANVSPNLEYTVHEQ